MTVLISDARRKLEQNAVGLSGDMGVSELLYADDTLLVEAEAEVAQRYMESVIEAGRVHGLSLNWSKVEMMQVGCGGVVTDPEGKPLKLTQRICLLYTSPSPRDS